MHPTLYTLHLYLKSGQTLHWLLAEAELAPFLTPLPTWPKLLYLRLADGGVRQLFRCEIAAVEAMQAGTPPPQVTPAVADPPPGAGTPPAWQRAPDQPEAASLAVGMDPW